MSNYTPTEIEKKWQAYWAKNQSFAASFPSNLPKYYVLDMFPYPSGSGLHVGHPLGYIASDIIARYKRHAGFNVLHPMGYDSFGLPAEQYAIQTGQHPKKTTADNIKRYREQLDRIGFSFDWQREVQTSDASYYKWTQWIFLQLFNAWFNPRNNKAESIETLITIFEKEGFSGAGCDILTGDIEEDIFAFSAKEWQDFNEQKRQAVLMNFRLAYLGEAYVNWCPALGTVLANDEVKEGFSERGGHPVERKKMKQWSMRITAFAERLLTGLETVDWKNSLKESQRNWIGKSMGCSLKFSVLNLTPAFSEGEVGVSPKYLTGDIGMGSILLQHAKEMRKEPTAAESLLWQKLREKKLEAKFRRQHPIDKFIPDFVCLDKRLIIEVDGGIHDSQIEQDDKRTARLNELGYFLLRFKNEEVIDETSKVLSKIRSVLSERPSIKDHATVLPAGKGLGWDIEVFTTRPDTIFGVSFITLAPEHALVPLITTEEQKTLVNDYINESKGRSERERLADVARISGVFTGAYALHPITQKPIPIWIGDYVLVGYGTGAVMSVPAHDSRDYAFAKHFDLPILPVIKGTEITQEAHEAKEGIIENSEFLNGLEVKDAIKKAIAYFAEKNIGTPKVNFRLRDAAFGRQRYWGEPIPIYYNKGMAYPIATEYLPLVLPEIDVFLPTEDGEPPLARAEKWYYVPGMGICQPQDDKEGKGGLIETTTMPGWAGSSWYFFRYMDANNDSTFASPEALKYWGQVDLYLGGSEHATGHLLYSRFWTKVLHDLGYVPFDEPAKKLINQGMIQGMSCIIHRVQGENKIISKGLVSNYENTSALHIDISLVSNGEVDVAALKKWRPDEFGTANFELENNKLLCDTAVEKMSKRWYNVVNPDDVCEQYGADTLRMYEMFLGPLEEPKPWNTQGIEGVSRFLRKLWRLFHQGENESFLLVNDEANTETLKSIHRLIKKVSEDMENFSFNTSVSAFMVCVNELTDLKCKNKSILEKLLVLLSPYAPHIAEELWSLSGNQESIVRAEWPIFEPSYLVESTFNYPVSINGKVRTQIEFDLNTEAKAIETEVLNNPIVAQWIEGKPIKKFIFVKGRIINVVI